MSEKPTSEPAVRVLSHTRPRSQVSRQNGEDGRVTESTVPGPRILENELEAEARPRIGSHLCTSMTLES